MDIRDVDPADLAGFDAVIHLAGLSNDPLGDLNPDCTTTSTTEAGPRLAERPGRPASSASSSPPRAASTARPATPRSTRAASFNPVTPYGHSKVLAEEGMPALADDDFSPTFLRNATAYGVSPRLRVDLVVNNLVGLARHDRRGLMKSDGTPWRPLVHIEDISPPSSPRSRRRASWSTTGRSTSDAPTRTTGSAISPRLWRSTCPGARIGFAADAGPDLRNYRVNCDLPRGHAPGVPAPVDCAASASSSLRDAYRRPVAHTRMTSRAHASCASPHHSCSGPGGSTTACVDTHGDRRLGEGRSMPEASEPLPLVPDAGDSSAFLSLGPRCLRGRPRDRRRGSTEPDDSLPARRSPSVPLLTGADPRDGAARDPLRRRLPVLLVVLRRLLRQSRAHAVELIERRGLGSQSLVVEIASNDGYLLRNFVARRIPVLGIDPAPARPRPPTAAGIPTLRTSSAGTSPAAGAEGPRRRHHRQQRAWPTWPT